MIVVRYRDRLGNRLFQYCLGRILAEDLGFALKAEGLPGFPGTHKTVEGISVNEPAQILTGQKIDLVALGAQRSPRKIILDGWFQRYEYYRPWRQKIRQWLTIDPAFRTRDNVPDLIIHVRRADYVQKGWALPYSYYDQAIKLLLPQGGEVWIATDDKHDPFFRRFSPWKPKFFRSASLETMHVMSLCPRLVMSQSSFSWWATFLGDVKQIVCPMPRFGVWSGVGEFADVDLIEKDRFTCLECTEAYEPTKLEVAYQRMRRAIRGVNRRLRPTSI